MEPCKGRQIKKFVIFKLENGIISKAMNRPSGSVKLVPLALTLGNGGEVDFHAAGGAANTSPWGPAAAA